MHREHFSPSKPDQRRLLERIIRTAPVTGTKAQALLTFLFERSIRGQFAPIKVAEIVTACSPSGGSRSPNAMNAEIKRIKDLLVRFFDSRRDGDNKEPVRVEIETGTHLLLFKPNRTESPRVRDFWAPYFYSVLPTLLYYPEPQFFRYRNNVYIRHLEINSPDKDRNIEKLLHDGPQSHSPIPSHSFVPSGLVAAMARLFECFLANGSSLQARVLGQTNQVPSDKNNIIILGTPTTSLQLINSVEREWPMRTETEAEPNTKAVRNVVVVAQEKPHDEKYYFDQTQEDDDSIKNYVHLEKWACLTRRIDDLGRVITVLAGHSRSVQGVASFLTQEEQVRQLGSRFRSRFPSQFQALFAVRMQKLRGELELQATTVKEAVNLGRKGGDWSTKRSSA